MAKFMNFLSIIPFTIRQELMRDTPFVEGSDGWYYELEGHLVGPFDYRDDAVANYQRDMEMQRG